MKEVYRVIDRGDYGKLTNIITLRYIFNSTACVRWVLLREVAQAV